MKGREHRDITDPKFNLHEGLTGKLDIFGAILLSDTPEYLCQILPQPPLRPRLANFPVSGPPITNSPPTMHPLNSLHGSNPFSSSA